MTAAAQLDGAQGGKIGLLVDYLASSPAFQARRGVDTPEDAAQWVHWPGALFDPLQLAESERPFAVVSTLPIRYAKFADAATLPYLMPAGAIRLILQDNDRFRGDLRSSYCDFQNWIDAVLADLVETIAVEGTLPIREIRQTLGPVLSDPTSTPLHWIAGYQFEWGSF